jgi:ABC-type cobalamin transport system ATPase subunit
MHSPMCSQCHEQIETAAHIIICDQPLAIIARCNMLDDMLHKLEKQGTPNIMLQTFNYMLSLTLNLPYDKVTSQWTHDFIPHVLLWGFISTK